MKVIDGLMRSWFPRQYCIWGRRRTENENRLQMESAGNLSSDERYRLRQNLGYSLWEWDDWLREIDDNRLVTMAAKMDIDLDDIPLPPQEPGERPSHYELGNWGSRFLAHETRKALKAKMREKAPAYRKERREMWDLLIKAVPFITGLLGTAIGLIATIKK
jgi:hypothetical protein